MTRKATEQVTTIGIDIGKNSFLLIDLDGGFGSAPNLRGGTEIASDSTQAVFTPWLGEMLGRSLVAPFGHISDVGV